MQHRILTADQLGLLLQAARRAGHLTQAIVEMMSVSVGEVVQLMLSRVHAASRHGMQ